MPRRGPGPMGASQVHLPGPGQNLKKKNTCCSALVTPMLNQSHWVSKLFVCFGLSHAPVTSEGHRRHREGPGATWRASQGPPDLSKPAPKNVKTRTCSSAQSSPCRPNPAGRDAASRWDHLSSELFVRRGRVLPTEVQHPLR